MGRATEFLDYINRAPEDFFDEEGEYKVRYHWIEIGWDAQQARKRFRVGMDSVFKSKE
jgi:hypothetical protein